MYRYLLTCSMLATMFTQCTCELNETSETWLTDAGRAFGTTIADCWSRTRKADKKAQGFEANAGMLMFSCLQDNLRVTLAKALSSDVIPLTDGVELIRYRKRNHTEQTERTPRLRSGVGGGKFDHDTSLLSSWRSLLIDTISDVFQTHAIRIMMRDSQTDADESEGRRKKGNLMPLMMFGLVGLGMILVPMGFQFLAVLGGKALLLAKMALILTSIQGLKKIAASKVNYGLYHSAQDDPWYDRKAEDLGYSYRTDEPNYHPFPGHVLEYKHI